MKLKRKVSLEKFLPPQEVCNMLGIKKSALYSSKNSMRFKRKVSLGKTPLKFEGGGSHEENHHVRGTASRTHTNSIGSTAGGGKGRIFG